MLEMKEKRYESKMQLEIQKNRELKRKNDLFEKRNELLEKIMERCDIIIIIF